MKSSDSIDEVGGASQHTVEPSNLDRTRGVRLIRAGRALDLVPKVDVDGLDGGVAARIEDERRVGE